MMNSGSSACLPLGISRVRISAWHPKGTPCKSDEDKQISSPKISALSVRGHYTNKKKTL